MSNKILSIEKKVPKVVTLPDGYYTGTLGGYSIELHYQKETYELKVEEGVRGMGIPVVVCIVDSEATYEMIKI